MKALVTLLAASLPLALAHITNEGKHLAADFLISSLDEQFTNGNMILVVYST